MSFQTLLAFDTCTELCSVALLYQDKTYVNSVVAQRSHSEKLLPMIDELLVQANISLDDVHYLVTSQGPGSFTGVRICNSIAQGLAYGADLNVVQVSTLATLAQEVIHKHPNVESIYCMLDARMGELYLAHYKNEQGFAALQDKEQVVAPKNITLQDKNNTILVGNGASIYSDFYGNFDHIEIVADIQFPQAIYMLDQARRLVKKKEYRKSFDIKPEYLRNDVAWKKQEIKR